MFRSYKNVTDVNNVYIVPRDQSMCYDVPDKGTICAVHQLSRQNICDQVS